MPNPIKPSVALAFISFIMLFLAGSMLLLHVEPHIPLIVALILLSLLAKGQAYDWSRIEEAMIRGISKGLKPILIMALIGVITAAWMASGTVPTILFYGLKLITPQSFLLSSLLLTVLVSTFTGSSFTTVGTIGPAVMGLGIIFGFDSHLIAGAIISGACFGDKMSPLSDTTNFASAITEINLYQHIQNMVYTTLPALALTCFLYILLSNSSGGMPSSDITSLMNGLESHFYLGFWTLIAPAIIIIGAIRQCPILPLLVLGIAVSTITALFQKHGLSLVDLISAYHHGLHMSLGQPALDKILNRGGLDSMLSSIALIMIALAFGGLALSIQLFESVFQAVRDILDSRFRVIAGTGFGGFLVNVITGEMYLSILLPGQIFKRLFDENAVPRKYLSRTLEDFGTLLNPIIPWGVSGAFFSNVLQVPVLDYVPYATFLYLCPAFSLVYAAFLSYPANSRDEFDQKA